MEKLETNFWPTQQTQFYKGQYDILKILEVMYMIRTNISSDLLEYLCDLLEYLCIIYL